MVQLVDLPPATQTGMRNLDCPTFERKPFVSGPPLSRAPDRGHELGRTGPAWRAAFRFG